MPTPKRRKLHFSPLRNSCSDMIIVQKWVFWSLGQRLYLAWPPRVNPELCSLSLLDLDGNIYFQKNEKKCLACQGTQMATPESPGMNTKPS